MDMAVSTMNRFFKLQGLRNPVRVSSRGYNLLAGALNYGMLIALAFTLAYWAWQVIAPPALPAVAASPLVNQEAVSTISARHWFGGNGISTSGASAETALNIKLVGIFGSANNKGSTKTSNTSNNKKQAGFAIFQLKDGKQVYAMLNQEITPGLKLTEIAENAVTVEQDGLPVKIVLEEKTSPLEIPRIKSTPATRKQR